MSNRRTRKGKSDFDYRVYHNTGEKVSIDRTSEKMASPLEEKKLLELQIFDDIKYTYDTNLIAEIEGVEELGDLLIEISDLTKRFRHVHVELKLMLGEGYADAYPDFDKRLEGLKQFTSAVKERIKLQNSTKISSQKELVISSLKIEDEIFRDRLEKEFELFKIDESSKIEEIRENCTKFEHFLEESYSLMSKAKIGLGDEFQNVFGTSFQELITRIRDKIEVGKDQIKKIMVELEAAASKEKVEKEKETRKQFIVEQKFQAKALLTELKNRSDSLVQKCCCDTLKASTDFQILDLQKDLVSVDREMREIFGVVTAFSKIASSCGDEMEEMLKEPEVLKEKALKARNAYAKELYIISTTRDISEEKLKNQSCLEIELGKFQGYESKTDIYTFKSDFEKLIQPKIQKPYWIDTLKKNYLCGPALVLVDKMDDIDKIWQKLFESYGNVKLLLQTKMNNLDKLGNLEMIEGDEKLVNALAKVINVMTELSTLAEKHQLETKLYVGGGLEKVFRLVGEKRERRFLGKYLDQVSDSSSITPVELEEKATWKALLAFLQKELTFRTTLTLNQKSKECLGVKNPPKKKLLGGQNAQNTFSSASLPCHICGKTDHVLSTDQNGQKQVDYFACPIFASMSCEKRREELQKKGFCFQCLTPGMKHSDPHQCNAKYTCTDPWHKKFSKGFHILVCDRHKTSPGNITLLGEYKKNVINQRSGNFKEFTRNIGLHCVYTFAPSGLAKQGKHSKILPDVPDCTIFMFQTIDFHGHRLRILFDTGGTRTVIKKSAIDLMINLGLAQLEVPDSKELIGVGGNVTTCTNGIYSFLLPLKDGCIATFTGVCLDRVTATFPTYPLEDVEVEVRDLCFKQGGEELLSALPALPKEVGGDIDILIGLTYKKYFPKEVWQSPTGLFVSDSLFLSEDGTTGVIGGPHAKFTEVQCEGQNIGTTNFFSHLAKTIECVRSAVPSDIGRIEMLSEKSIPSGESDEYSSDQELDGSTQLIQLEGRVLVARKPPKCVKRFDEIESAGTEVLYRCNNCRNCQECKKSLRIDVVSIQEEIESEIIDQCVSVDIEKGESVAKLPFVVNPESRLKPNDRMALKVYETQVRNLSKKPEDKQSAILFEGKLQELGFVDYLHNLSSEQQQMILDAETRYFIPWFTVWNENSVSTPCRIVFDASRCDSSGCSLNNLLAKGINNMNSLLAILIRWGVHKFAYHTDISKMYNRVGLDESHWRYQLYLWDAELRVGVQPVWKVVKTLIYGVKPSGQLAEVALRKLAGMVKDVCPLAYPVIMHDIYVDDNLSGANSIESRNKITDQLVLALSKGGFSLKGFTFSGQAPPEHLSADGVSVIIGGVKYFSEADEFSLNISDLNFGKRKKGRKAQDGVGVIPLDLTRVDCVSKVAEIFDPTGRCTPITSGFKIDINQLTLRKLDWDDHIPDDLRKLWVSNFDMMQELRNIRFKRAVIPEDAVNTDVETICVADASNIMICVGIYARFRRRSGGFSCQLLLGRSKVVPKDMSLPRAELLAASVNAATAHVVKTSLGEMHKKSWMLTDSQVALHWIHCTKSKLKMWVRNRVIEINRLVERETWRYVESKQNVADLGTRKGAKLEWVGPDGAWTNGYGWMQGEESDFPVKTIEQVILDNEARSEARKEEIIVEVLKECQYFIGHLYMPEQQVPEEVGLRYKFCDYLIDPNKFRFRKVVRVLGLVFKFLQNMLSILNRTPKFVSDREYFNIPDMFSHQEEKYLVTTGSSSRGLKCAQGLVVELPEAKVKDALAYFFRKSSLEIKHFLPKQKYLDISKEIDGILYYSGRILPEQRVENRSHLADVSFDLCEKSFCVPMVDRLSPVAYSIASDVHWHHFDVRHGGIESVLREIQCIAYLISGRKLVKDIKLSCIRCRILRKKRLEVVMGPKHDGNLCIAPAFHTTQVDICGSFDSFSSANKKAKIKRWFVVFCCIATGAVDIKVMPDYSTDSFILAFIRFSCRYGYPCSLLPDPGSQLIRGCKDMILSFSDIQHQLSVEYGVSFQTCPVGAHYVHGKVERKIQTIKESIEKALCNERLSLIQWETLGQQIANSINNLPIGLGNKISDLENLDILTPNRLLLGRNNSRGPTAPLVLTRDVKKIVQMNSDIFSTWFRSWLVSYVPSLMDAPKWFRNDRNITEGDVVLFTKSEKEFEDLYQYGIIKSVSPSKDGRIRKVEVEYQNSSENVKRSTIRGVRDLIVIHPVDELGLSKQLFDLAISSDQ